MTCKTQWSREQQADLFALQAVQGNRWAFIASQLTNKKDVASIKNKFYSTLRKGHRKLNNYIKNIKKKENPKENKAVKPIQQIFIVKLVSVADNNYDAKYQVKEAAIKLAHSIQKRLINIALDEHEYETRQRQSYENQQRLVEDILQFNKSCKKRKGKKKIQQKPQRKVSSNKEHQIKQQNECQLYQSEMIDEESQQQDDNNKHVVRNKKVMVNKDRKEEMQGLHRSNFNFVNHIKKFENKEIEFQSKNLGFFMEARNNEINGGDSLKKSQHELSYNWLLESTTATKKKAESFHKVIAPTPTTFFGVSNFANFSINSYVTSSINSNIEDRPTFGQQLVTSTILEEQMNDALQNSIIKQILEQSLVIKAGQSLFSSLQTTKINKNFQDLNDRYSFNPNHEKIYLKKGKSQLKNNQKGVITQKTGDSND